MTNKIKDVYIFSKEDFRKWLEKNHDKEDKVNLILHKKHTGKPSPSHRELMEEAICFGWIDTTIKRIDEEKYIRRFSKRTEKSTWSYNTLSYGKQLIKQKRMTEHGLKFYNKGLKKLPHDYGLSKNPRVPKDLKEKLDKNKKAREKFEKISASSRKMHLRYIERAKMNETRKRRIDSLIKIMEK